MYCVDLGESFQMSICQVFGKSGCDTALIEPLKVCLLSVSRDLVLADPPRPAGQRRRTELDGQAEEGGRRLHRFAPKSYFENGGEKSMEVLSS